MLINLNNMLRYTLRVRNRREEQVVSTVEGEIRPLSMGYVPVGINVVFQFRRGGSWCMGG